MAQLNFPPLNDTDPLPSNGEVWTDPNGNQWEYNASIPAWKSLASVGPGIRYRGGIDLFINPSNQYDDIASGNLFSVTNGSSSVNGAFYPGLSGDTVEVGSQIIFDGIEWQYNTIMTPYATTEIAGKVELATTEDAVAGVNNTKALTPKTGVELVAAQSSLVFATSSEVTQASITDKALTPASVQNVVASVQENTANRVPVGMIMWYAGEIAPYGWLACNGDSIYESGASISLFQHLRSLKGDRWGEGEVSVNLPDLRNLLNPGQSITLLACIKL